MPPRVTSYMSSPVITALRNDNLAHVRNLMIRHRIGKVVIADSNGSIAGIISKSDFIRIVYNRKRYIKPLSNIMAYEIMSSPVYAIQPGRTIRAAAQAMLRRNIGSLLVVDRDKRLSGIITKADLVRAFAERYYGKAKVNDFMEVKVPTVQKTHSIYYVVDLMNETGMGKVVVTEGNKPVGVITKSDVMFLNLEGILGGRRVKFYKRHGVTGRGFEGIMRVYTFPLASDIMSPDPITVRPNEDLAKAADVMVKNRIGTLPVVDEHDYLVGLLTKKHIIQAIRRV